MPPSPNPTRTRRSCCALEARDRAARRLDPLPVVHVQQVARYRAVARQQDRAHQVAGVGKRAGQVAHLVGRAAEIVDQQRRLLVAAVGGARAAPALRRQLERRPVLDHVRLEWPLDALIGLGDRGLGGGHVRGELGRRHGDSATRRRVPRLEFARGHAASQARASASAACPPCDCACPDLCHPVRELSRRGRQATHLTVACRRAWSELRRRGREPSPGLDATAQPAGSRRRGPGHYG